MINLQWLFLIFSPLRKVMGAFHRTRCADAVCLMHLVGSRIIGSFLDFLES